MVIGCSVGAINGAAFADGPTLEGIARHERVWRGLDRQDLLPTGWSNAVSLARRGEAVHDHSGLRRMIEESLQAASFEELEVAFECVATDVAGVQEVWFDSGPLVEPILASSALPAIYPAVEIGGVRYLDGGIVNDVPMSRAVERGARTIYILQVGSFMRPRREPRRPLDVAVQAYWVARHHRFKRELDALPPDVDVHVLPTGETPRMRFNDFTHSATLIARAHEASSAYLDELATGRQPASPVDGLPAAVTAPTPSIEPVESVGAAEPDGRSVSGNGAAPGQPGASARHTVRADGPRVGRRRAPASGNGAAPDSTYPDGAPVSDPDESAGVGSHAVGQGSNGDHDGSLGSTREDGAERLPGVRRWARATMLHRITDRPPRRAPARSGTGAGSGTAVPGPDPSDD